MMSNGNGYADSDWDEDDVRDILLNPVHTMGSSPTVSNQNWIEAQSKLLDELGVDSYFSQLLSVVQQTFGQVVE